LRYIEIPNISFIDRFGTNFPVKDLREYPQYETAFIKKIIIGDFIDELASRNDIYGEQSEDLSYLIFEHNIEKIVEARWDLTKIKSFRIPVQNNS